MQVFTQVSAFRAWRKSLSLAQTTRSVGLVPTMGALHAGHESLLTRSKAENAVTILTLFVNPTQFNRPDDFQNYPKTLEADLSAARRLGVDAVLSPRDSTELYPDGYAYQVSEKAFSKQLCGAHRPGHFEGVLTIVMKLFQLARADRAYFGEKDFQQMKLIEGMTRAFFLDTEVVACPTIREADGLAMSSRNLRLKPCDRARAPALFRAMTEIQDLTEAKAAVIRAGFEVDYLEDLLLADGSKRRFAAASLSGIRLIDNVGLRHD